MRDATSETAAGMGNRPRFRAVVAFALLLAIGLLPITGCAGGQGSNGQATPDAEASRTALPPPDLVAPASDASGKPLIAQPDSAESAQAIGTVDYSCTTDADCAVKDVGNCCGYYPACVNVDSPTFPEQVKAECAKNDMMSTCGFRDISSCACVDGRCAAGPATEGEVVR